MSRHKVLGFSATKVQKIFETKEKKTDYFFSNKTGVARRQAMLVCCIKRQLLHVQFYVLSTSVTKQATIP